MPGPIRATAVNRAREYPDELYCDNGILFCKSCCLSVDTKQSTIKDHLSSKRHLDRKNNANRNIMPRQITMETAIRSNEERSNFVMDFVKMRLKANIPLEKCEKMKPFLVKHTKQGGMIRSAQHLRQQYVPKVCR